MGLDLREKIMVTQLFGYVCLKHENAKCANRVRI